MHTLNIQSPDDIYDYLRSCDGEALQQALQHLSTQCLVMLNTWIAYEIHERLIKEVVPHESRAH